MKPEQLSCWPLGVEGAECLVARPEEVRNHSGDGGFSDAALFAMGKDQAWLRGMCAFLFRHLIVLIVPQLGRTDVCSERFAGCRIPLRSGGRKYRHGPGSEYPEPPRTVCRLCRSASPAGS